MKSSITLLISILAVTAISIVDAQKASAQNETGARWKFAPNIYKIEQPRIPQNIDGPRAVTQGAMPRSSNFLGVDNGMLTPAPPKPVAKPVPASQVSHKLFVPNTAYKPDFGKPQQPLTAGNPVKMATLPPGAGSPNQKPAPPTATKASAPVQQPKHSAPARHINRSTAVAGRLKTKLPHGSAATPEVATYNTGYMPGGSLPASGVGMRTHADVSGKIIKQKH